MPSAATADGIVSAIEWVCRRVVDHFATKGHVRTMRKLLPFLLVAAAASACTVQYVRPIKKTPTGGEFALYAQDSEGARAEAARYMASQCVQGFDVVEEGETTVGTHTVSNTQGSSSRQAKSGDSSHSSSTSSSTADEHEWRVKFKCKDVAAPAAGAPEPEQKAAPSSPGPQSAIQSIVVRF